MQRFTRGYDGCAQCIAGADNVKQQVDLILLQRELSIKTNGCITDNVEQPVVTSLGSVRHNREVCDHRSVQQVAEVDQADDPIRIIGVYEDIPAMGILVNDLVPCPVKSGLHHVTKPVEH